MTAMVVLYRKYRPQKISEIDNSFVAEKLETLLSAKEIFHAFLFTGPKGTGKTSSARIIAKSLNCEKNDGHGEPCNKCSTCLSITNGSNMDIIEMDAASNRGIDEIRDLRDKIRLAPAGCRKKVYIIDEVHMLTNEAFNSLLKTLEEPPVHAVFILCTTNPEKLPETIVSRCQRIEFGRAKIDDLVVSLKRVKKGEEREIENEALIEIAQRSDGSYRDSHKLLEEILTAYPRAKITLELVKKVLGEKEAGADLFAWVNPPDAKKGLGMIGKLVQKGADFKFITETILNMLHEALLQKYGLENKDAVVYEQLNNLTIEQLKSLLELFSKAGQELKTAIIPQLPLELAVVEWCSVVIPAKSGIPTPNDQLGRVSKFFPVQNPAGSRFAPFVPQKFDTLPADSEETPKSSVTRRFPENETEALAQKWDDLLFRVKPYNHSVAGLLRSCKPISFDGKELIFEVFYKFHFDKLSEPKTYGILEKAGAESFGKKIKIKPEFKPKEVKNVKSL